MPLARVPSTGTTSPCLIRMRSPGTTASSLTSSSSAPRCRMVVRGTRDRSAVISRRARRSAKLSRYWPPAYITATTTPASSSPKASAALIESAATMSRPKSPLRRLETISKRRVSNTGNANAAQTKRDHSASPSGRRAKPRTRPVAGNRTRSGRRRMPRDGEFGLSLTPTHPSHLGANLPEDAIHPLNLADGAGKSLDRVIASPFSSTTGTPRPSTHSVNYPTPRAFRFPTASIASRSAVGCHRNTGASL